MFFRAFYAIRALSNSKGMPTNALYGYLSMTIKLLKDKKPDYMAYCFDSKEPSFRKDIFPDYKANRTEMPEELVKQMPYFQPLTQKLGIPVFQQSGVEADDIIGTLTVEAQKHGIQVVIVSGDKDFAQLINPNVSMYDTMKEVIYDVPGVKEKWGIKPDQMIDYLALIGDASDNIPGIAGVGPKTALKLLDQFDSLEGIYKNVEDVKPDKLREKVKNSKEIALLSQELVTIKKDLPLKSAIEDLSMKPIVRADLVELLTELDFKTFERKIFGSSGESASEAPKTSTESSGAGSVEVKNEEQKTIVNKAPQIPVPAVSPIELNVTEETTATPESVQTSLKKNQEVWVINDNRGFYISDEKNIFALTGDLHSYASVFNDLDLKWKGFDLKSIFKSLNLEKPKSYWDHQIAAYVINAGNIGSFQEVCEKYCSTKLSDFPNAQELVQANANLEQVLRDRLKLDSGDKIFQEFDLPLISVLYSMEKYGVKIDKDILKEQSEGLHKDIRELEKNIYDLSGETFNIASPKQLAHVLFEKLKLTPIKKTKTGLSTDSDVLEKLENEHPVARLIIEYRELAKLKSTYVDSLPLLVDPKDDRIHTQFHQTVTTTGRLSSTNPNLQNIPIRTVRGNAIRKAFIAEKNCEIISADYSQIELRVLAHVTKDTGLVKAFENDLDIHAATASEVFGIPLDQVTSDNRRVAKAVNFGLAYGMGPHGLASNLGISRSEASEIIHKYFAKFPGVKDYMTNTVEIAKQKGFVETIFGRRRYSPELQSKNAAIRNFGERAAINAPMQGTAADIVKKAMIDIYRDMDIKMIVQVHDELLFEVPKADVEKMISMIRDKMENVVKLSVPLKVNISHGPSWFDAH